MAYRLHDASGTPTRTVYQTEEKATRALARRKEVGSAVVWYNDAGVAKLWCGYWTAHGWNQVQPAVATGRVATC